MEGLNRMFRGQGMAGVGSAPPGAVCNISLPHERYVTIFMAAMWIVPAPPATIADTLS